LKTQKTVLIIGGGLAGLSAACELVDHGFSVKILERKSFLGGRVYSILDPVTGDEVDNSQHVFTLACTHLIRFLDKIGSLKKNHYSTPW